jgi:hypothetical protein
MGGAVRYWLDGRARVHRFEALLARDLPVRVELLRDDRTVPAAIAALGGRAVTPRGITRREAGTLSQLRLRNRDAGGGAVRMTLPTPDGATHATGWVDWRDTVAYLRLTGPGHPRGGMLLRADRFGIAIRPAATRDRRDRPAAGDDRRNRPPLPPPNDGWRLDRWSTRGDARGTFDVDLLLNELLTLGSPVRDRVRPLRAHAGWLREDELRGRPVAVYELPKPAERGVRPGQARLRYWVGRAGVLRRLELRTRSGGFAQLDVVPGRTPQLAPMAGTVRARH